MPTTPDCHKTIGPRVPVYSVNAPGGVRWEAPNPEPCRGSQCSAFYTLPNQFLNRHPRGKCGLVATPGPVWLDPAVADAHDADEKLKP